MEMSHQSGVEAQSLLRGDQRNGANIVNLHQRRSGEVVPEKTPFLHNEPVRLTPAWEGSNLPNDTLNLKGIAMDINPPKDRWNLIYITLLIHGIGTLIAWNMLITSKEYFVTHKLVTEPALAADFMPYLGIAAQFPNLLFNWLNVFVQFGGSLTKRIIWSLSIEVIIFVITVILAMTDTTDWTVGFFWLTMVTVIILNICNGIFQNTVYGVAARLPSSYTGAVVLGSNISGTVATLLGLLFGAVAPSARAAAVYFFITGLLVLLACFDTYFALPLNRFYRYHDNLLARAAQNQEGEQHFTRPPYGLILKQSWVQLFNIFFTFFITLAIFPNMHSDIKQVDPHFIIPSSNFTMVTCFLTFNFTAMLGNLTATFKQWPSPRYLIILVLLRLLFMPMFLLFNYQPMEKVRTLPVLFNNDWVYWITAMLMGWSSGHCSSLGMMYVSSTVDPVNAPTAGMLGAAFLITGINAGIFFTVVFPLIVSAPFFGTSLAANGTNTL